MERLVKTVRLSFTVPQYARITRAAKAHLFDSPEDWLESYANGQANAVAGDR